MEGSLYALAITITAVSLKLLRAPIGRVWAGIAPGASPGAYYCCLKELLLSFSLFHCLPPLPGPGPHLDLRMPVASSLLPLRFRSLLSQCLAVELEQVALGL